MLLILFIFALTCSTYIQALPTVDILAEDRTLKDAAGEYLGWFVPLIGGGFQWITRDEFELELASTQTFNVDIKILLYTNENPTVPQVIPYNDALALAASNFNENIPTRTVIHGWMNDWQSPVNTEIIPALLASGVYNVFSIDWSSSSKNIIYPIARNAVESVGILVANFFDFLHEQFGMNFSDLHCIGHSLGSHVCGFAGKNVQLGTINIIYALDPALPLFYYNNNNTRVSINDANYVESIQTNGGKLGFLDPIGDCAFYPNGGKSQPACSFDIIGKCSHLLAHTYFAESLTRDNFLARKCSSTNNAINNKCDSEYSSTRMGSASNYGTSGIFYVPVKKTPSYGMGV